jgi:two-component system, NarL family, response regulator NreC
MANIYKKNTEELPYRQSRLRVIIADDHTILRQGLRSILDADPDLEVIGEASSVQDALALARCLRPDVVISDVSFENGSGIRTIGRLRRECAGVRVIMLTGHDSEECERAAMLAGAHAYILKDSPIEVLLRAIYSASAEGVDAAIPPRELPNRRAERPAAIIDMTARERQVLIGVALGYSSKRIAGQLGRSVKTIEKHRFKMMHKLGLHNAAAVTRYAMDNGLLEDRGAAQESRPSRIDFPEP